MTEHIKEPDVSGQFSVPMTHNPSGRTVASACSATCSIIISQNIVNSSTRASNLHTARFHTNSEVTDQ